MRDLKNKLITSGKGLTNIQSRRTKSFGYQVLGFGAGGGGAKFIVATGGSPACGTTSGDYKIHKFTGPGTFCVSTVAACAALNVVSYMVQAGGGAGSGGYPIGGGGAGGFREYKSSEDSYTASPLDGNPGGTAITVTATGYPITVGGGGAPSGTVAGAKGSDSVFSCITSTGGGSGSGATAGGDGGSGGGGGGQVGTQSGGTGNTPSVTPAQGKDGGDSHVPDASNTRGGGGGGATVAGASGATSGSGGAGATTSISGSPTAYGGGGGGGSENFTAGAGGSGGGGTGGQYPACNATDGTVNTGGGAGNGYSAQKNGGSGVVFIRYKFQ